MKHISLTKFDDHQAYKDGRSITWIKLLVDIINEFDKDGIPKKYYKMPDTAKLTYLHLLCLAPRFSNNIPYPDDKWLKSQLGISNLNLQPIEEQGFVEISASSVQIRTDSYRSVPEKEKEKEREKENDISVIFDCWNKYKKYKKFKGHQKITPEIERAVSLRLKEYSVSDISQAIDNYAKVLLGNDYRWSYAWTLYQFLTRHNPQYRDELQIYRFLPNNFSDYDYLTDQSKRSKVIQEKKPTTPAIKFDPASHWQSKTDEQVKKEYLQGNRTMKELIAKHRPDVLGMVKEA